MEEIKIANPLVPRASKDATTLCAAIAGDIDLSNSPELRSILMEMVVKNAPQKLVLNLSKVPYMDSSAIAVLVELLQRMRKTGGKIFLTELQPRVKGLLEIARLQTIFQIAATDEDALK